MGEARPSPQEQYWESEVFPAWSAKLTFSPGSMPYEQFRQTVNTTAEAQRHRYTGLITRDPAIGYVTSFTRTIYPRKKYPVTRPEDCAAGMARLAESFGTAVEDDNVAPDSYRIPIGLYIGQDDDSYDRPPDHNVVDIQHTLASRGLLSTATLAEVFTVRFTENGTANYIEPVAVIIGPTHEASAVCDLAVELGQERFTLEQFPLHTAPQVQMVETTHCREPEWITDAY